MNLFWMLIDENILLPLARRRWRRTAPRILIIRKVEDEVQ